MRYNETLVARMYRRDLGAYIEALNHKKLDSQKIGTNGILVSNSERNVVPVIRAPLVLNADHPKNSYGKTFVFTDYSVFSKEDVSLIRLCGVLTAAWESEEHRLQELKPLAAYVYANWIGGMVSNRFGISEVSDVLDFKIMLWLSFYANGRDLEKVLDAPATANIADTQLGVEVYRIQDIIRKVKDYKCESLTLHDICHMAADLSPVFKQKVTPETVMATVTQSWGSTTKALAQLAVEYPPAFIAGMSIGLVSTATYRKTPFGTMLQNTLFKGRRAAKAENFTRQLNYIVGELTKD